MTPPIPEKTSDAQIIKAYKSISNIEKDVEMAKALGISRQCMSNYMRGVSQPEFDILKKWFFGSYPAWVRAMTLDIYKNRPSDHVPCVCLERLGDNGPCPQHYAHWVKEINTATVDEGAKA